jgi:hypothetical protein
VRRSRTLLFAACLLSVSVISLGVGEAMSALPRMIPDEGLRAEAGEALGKALDFMLTLQRNGAWARAWSADGSQVWGKDGNSRDPEVILVRQHGTPGIARVFLRAYVALGEERYLEAARRAADTLWANRLPPDDLPGWPMDLVPGKPKVTSYRQYASFWSNTTEGVASFLADLYRVTRDEKDHERLVATADFIVMAQHPSGGWSQGYPLYNNYKDNLTINDNTIPDIVRALLHVYEVLGESRYYDAAMRGVEWLLQAQLHDPHPVWAQQYDRVTGKPAQGRAYELPAATAGESADVVRFLMDLYVETGEMRYKKAVDNALEWYRRVRLPNGKWARFYTLGTNEPLYATKAGKVVATAAEASPGYTWEGNWGESILADAALLEQLGREPLHCTRGRNRPPSP